MTPPRRFARAAAAFSASRLLGACLRFARTFILVRYLGPQDYGLWQFLNLFATYAPYASLGTQSALSRRLPYLRGTGDAAGQRAVLGTVGAAHAVSALAYTGGVALGAVWLADAPVAHAMLAFSPVILLLSWLHYAQLLAVAGGRFELSGRLQLQHELAAGVFTVALVAPWGLHGAIVAFGVSAALAVAMGLVTLAPDLSFTGRRALFWELVWTGLPLTANGFLITAMGTVDRWLIVSMLGTGALGVYGVANIGVYVLRVLPVSVAQLLVVRFAEMAGRDSAPAAVVTALDRSTAALACAAAGLIAAALAAFPACVLWLLPAFAEGIPAGRLLLADIFFLSVSLPVTNWCLAVGRSRPVLLLRGATVLAEGGAIALVLTRGGSLAAVALCVISGSALYAVSIWAVTGRALGRTWADASRRGTRVFLLFAPIAGALALHQLASDRGAMGTPRDALLVGVGILAMTTLGVLGIMLGMHRDVAREVVRAASPGVFARGVR